MHDRAVVSRIAQELTRYGLPDIDWEEHEAGTELAHKVGVLRHYRRLCHTWGAHFVGPNARCGLDPLVVEPDDLLFLRGDGTAANPGVVVVPSWDQLVYAKFSSRAALVFQVPNDSTVNLKVQQYHLAGPAPVGYDFGGRPGHRSTRFTSPTMAFFDGELGQEAGSTAVRRYTVSTASTSLHDLIRHDLLGLTSPPSSPSLSSSSVRSLAWTFLSPSPRRCPVGNVVEYRGRSERRSNGSWPGVDLAQGPAGTLLDGAGPAQSVEWALEVRDSGEGEGAPERTTHWRVWASRHYVPPRLPVETEDDILAQWVPDVFEAGERQGPLARPVLHER
ncbi:hypothetical protein JCM8208_007509 [Rhodotorula glutinis]